MTDNFRELLVDAEGTVDNVYEVAVYNVIGKESAKVKAE